MADGLGLFQGLGVELRVQQGIQLLRLHAQDSLFFGDHALVHHVDGDLQRRGRGSLAVAGLQHEQLAVLDGELHVLHVFIVVFERTGHLGELLVDLGQVLLELMDRLRRAHAGDHVFALGVDEVLAEQLLFARRRVAGERHARAGFVAGVAEHHLLHVDRGPPGIRNLVHAAVHFRAGVVPRAEHGLDGLQQLRGGVGGEVLALLLLVIGLELADKLFHVALVQLNVLLDAALGLLLVDDLLKVGLRQLHHHVGEHLDEPAVGVVGEARVVRKLREALHHGVVQAQVQDGVHHAGHRNPRAGADGNQQRVGGVAELLAGDFLQPGEVFENLGLDFVVDSAAVLIIFGAGFGRDGKPVRHGQAEAGHFGKAGALPAEQVAHLGVPFGEKVQILIAHRQYLLIFLTWSWNRA